MADFRPASAAELRLLKALSVAQRLQRRAAVRQALNLARVRLAEVLKARRTQQRVSDWLWKAQITQHEAAAYAVLARLGRRRKVYNAELQRLRARLGGDGGTA